VGVNERAKVVMSEAEVLSVVRQPLTATIATNGPAGSPHLVAMWYGVIDDEVWFASKMKAQKVRNLERDSSIAFMVWDGETYDNVRGVSIEGRALLSTDAADLWRLIVNIHERYNGPYSTDLDDMLRAKIRNRVAVRIDRVRIRSWDHSKL
jgi:PPOX class probable F420-dependent enzyme